MFFFPIQEFEDIKFNPVEMPLRLQKAQSFCAGTYWGQVSTPYCAEIVEGADVYLFAGKRFNCSITQQMQGLISPLMP